MAARSRAESLVEEGERLKAFSLFFLCGWLSIRASIVDKVLILAAPQTWQVCGAVL